MSDVFISYSRKDINFAKKLNFALEENDLVTWIDWQDIPPSTDWLAEVYEAIEQADAFIFIISSKSAKSEVCSKEVNYAIENNKRLIPIVIDDIDPNSIPATIASLNWIFFRNTDDFDTSKNLLLESIHTDQVWVKSHTRYQTRALEWERGNMDNAFLLSGTEIQEAELWLTQSDKKDPAPSDIQREFITTSRADNTRKQRRLFSRLSIGLVLTIGLSLFAFFQRNLAFEQSDLQATANAIAFSEKDARATAQANTQSQLDIAFSQNLAAESLALTTKNLDLKLLLSTASFDFNPGVEALNSLFDAIIAEENFGGIIMDDPNFFIQSVALNIYGTHLAVGNSSGEIRVFEAETGKLLNTLSYSNYKGPINSLSFSADGKKLISIDALGKTLMWDLDSDTPTNFVISDFDGWENFLAINSDGSEIAALTTSDQVAIWDPESEEILIYLEKSDHNIEPLIFSWDGAKLAGFNNKETVHYWYRETGERHNIRITLKNQHLETYDRHTLNSQYTLAFHPEGTALLLGTGYKTIFWNFEDDNLTVSDDSYSIGFDTKNDPISLVLSNSLPYQQDALKEDSSSYPLEINYGGEISGSNNLGYVFNALTEDCFIIWLDESGGTLITRYTFKSYIPIGESISNSKDLRSIANVPNSDSQTIISAGCAETIGDRDCDLGLIQMWSGEEWDPDGDPIFAHDDWISSISVSPDGSTFITASEDNSIILWDFSTLSPIGEPINIDFIGIDSNIEFHPDGKFAALYDGWDRIYFIDTINWELMGEPFNNAFAEEADTLRNFSFSSDGKFMALVHLGEISNIPVDMETSDGDLYLDYTLRPDGTYFFEDYQKAILAIWDISNPTEPALQLQKFLKDFESDELNLHGGGLKDFYPVAFNPDGSRIAVGIDGALTIVDSISGNTLTSSSKNTILSAVITDISYSPDGQLIATNDLEGYIQLHDGQNGLEIGQQLDGPGMIQDAMMFAEDSESFLSVFYGRRIYVYKVSGDYWNDVACNMVNRNFTNSEWQQYMENLDYREICPLAP